ncbi:MAG TPA: MerR family transcriptional regulator [Candidatus Limnocylindrales bacterium]
MKNLVPIGTFSRLCRLTIPALRHYDELGLLRPALVDPDTGYRYYSLAQAEEAERIRLLRSVELPLDEIRLLLGERDPAAVRRSLDAHRSRLLGRIDDTRASLAILDRIMDREARAMEYDVGVRETVAQPIVSVRGRTSAAEIPAFFGRAYGQIFRVLGEQGIRPSGPPFSIYHDPDFRQEDVDVEVAVPVSEPVETTDGVVGRTLAGGPVAYTVHVGAYDEVGAAYRALTGWAQANGRALAGPPREIYLVGPDQARDPGQLRTEIDWPIG